MDEKPKTKATLRNEELFAKHDAENRERQRLHSLKPAQERFIIAVQGERLDRVERFLKSGEIYVNYSQGYGGYTAMHRATQFASANMVQLLLDYGGDVRSISNDGWSPLGHALHRMSRRYTSLKPKDVERTVRALLLHGADVNASGNRGCTPLQSAVLYDRNSVLVKILLDHGAKISKTDDEGYNALHSLSDRESAASVRNKVCRTMLEHVQHDFKLVLKITAEMAYVNFDPDHDPDLSDSDNDVHENEFHTPEDLAEIFELPGLGEMIHAARMVALRQQEEWINAKNAQNNAKKMEDRRKRKTAVAMCLHSRLGANAEISTLGTDMLGMVAKYL
jgi:ankyrin repeat protein